MEQTAHEPTRPGQGWYLLAAVLFAVAAGLVALSVWTLVDRVATFGGDLRRFVAPGETELTVEKPGERSIYYEHKSTVDGRRFSTPKEMPPLTCEVTGPDGEAVSVEAPSGSVSYERSARKGKQVYVFTATKPGTYRVRASYPAEQSGPEVVLAVGQMDVLGFVGAVFGSCAALLLGGLLAVGGLVITIVVFLKRRRGPAPAGA